MLRQTKIALIFAVALWGSVGALFNLLDWSGTLASVNLATSMSTLEGGQEGWQATSSMIVTWLGALFILWAKILSAAFCWFGAHRMWSARTARTEYFSVAKQPALVGCGIAVFMLFSGFIVIAESFFELWRSELLRPIALESAFRYGAMISLIAIFVAQPESEPALEAFELANKGTE